MELIKNFTVGLVVVCIVGAVILILTPEGSVEKQVKTSVSLVMLLCFLYPFSSGVDLDFSFELPVDSDINFTAEEVFVNTFKSKLISDINNYLSDNGIYVEKTEIVMHTSAENEILIESATVYVKPEYKTETEYIRSLIKDKFGIVSRTEVCYESENR